MTSTRSLDDCESRFTRVLIETGHLRRALEALRERNAKSRQRIDESTWYWASTGPDGREADDQEELDRMASAPANFAERRIPSLVKCVLDLRQAIDTATRAVDEAAPWMDGEGQPRHRTWSNLAKRSLSRLRGAILWGFGPDFYPSCLPKLDPAVDAALVGAMQVVADRQAELKAERRSAHESDTEAPSRARPPTDALEPDRERPTASAHNPPEPSPPATVDPEVATPVPLSSVDNDAHAALQLDERKGSPPASGRKRGTGISREEAGRWRPPSDRTRIVSFAEGTRWFKMDHRTLRKALRDHTYACQQVSPKRFAFDLSEVVQTNPDADRAADPTISLD
jgi:hypothetical protein